MRLIFAAVLALALLAITVPGCETRVRVLQPIVQCPPDSVPPAPADTTECPDDDEEGRGRGR